MNNPTAKNKIIYKVLATACFVFLALVIFNPAPAAAQLTGSGPGFISEEDATAAELEGISLHAIDTSDEAAKKAIQKAREAIKKSSWQNFKDNLKKFSWDKVLEELKNSGSIAWRRPL